MCLLHRIDAGNNVLNKAEIYDGTSWTTTASPMVTGRWRFQMVVLPASTGEPAPPLMMSCHWRQRLEVRHIENTPLW